MIWIINCRVQIVVYSISFDHSSVSMIQRVYRLFIWYCSWNNQSSVKCLPRRVMKWMKDQDRTAILSGVFKDNFIWSLIGSVYKDLLENEGRAFWTKKNNSVNHCRQISILGHSEFDRIFFSIIIYGLVLNSILKCII